MAKKGQAKRDLMVRMPNVHMVASNTSNKQSQPSDSAIVINTNPDIVNHQLIKFTSTQRNNQSCLDVKNIKGHSRNNQMIIKSFQSHKKSKNNLLVLEMKGKNFEKEEQCDVTLNNTQNFQNFPNDQTIKADQTSTTLNEIDHRKRKPITLSDNRSMLHRETQEDHEESNDEEMDQEVNAIDRSFFKKAEGESNTQQLVMQGCLDTTSQNVESNEQYQIAEQWIYEDSLSSYHQKFN